MTTQASAGRAGLWPLGALSASRGGLLLDTFDGADLRALLLTVRTLPAADQSAFGVISQDCPTYTSWGRGLLHNRSGCVRECPGARWQHPASFCVQCRRWRADPRPCRSGLAVLAQLKGWMGWMPTELHQRRGSHACGHRPAVPVVRQSLWGACLGGLRPIFFSWQLVTHLSERGSFGAPWPSCSRRSGGEERHPHFLFRCSCLFEGEVLVFPSKAGEQEGTEQARCFGTAKKSPHDTTERCTSGE